MLSASEAPVVTAAAKAIRAVQQRASPARARAPGHHLPVTFDSSQISRISTITMKVPSSGIPITTPLPTRGRVAERGRREQSAHQRQGEDPVEEARMVVGEPAADGFGHQGVDAGVSRAEEECAGGGAERRCRW